jgi:P-type Cu+ transporter
MVGRGAQAGVLVKNADALERLEKVDALVIDKTGTLTEGNPKLVAIVPATDKTEAELLRLAASLERASEHPLAAAVIDGAAERGIALAAVIGFESTPAKGVSGTVEGHGIALGNASFLAERGVNATALSAAANRLRHDGATAILLAVDGDAAGILGVADPIKATTPDALKKLRADGLHVVMLTGDSRTTAEAVARQLGIA